VEAAFIWLRIGTCGHCNEHSGSIKCVEFLDQLSDWFVSYPAS
jgi:hypothetical protein